MLNLMSFSFVPLLPYRRQQEDENRTSFLLAPMKHYTINVYAVKGSGAELLFLLQNRGHLIADEWRPSFNIHNACDF